MLVHVCPLKAEPDILSGNKHIGRFSLRQIPRNHSALYTPKMSPIKDFTLIYESLNKEDTFSEGDVVAGTVTLTLEEETKVKSLVVKVKGEARVQWTETESGDKNTTHTDHRRYFKDKEYLVAENSNGRNNKNCVICLLVLTLRPNLWNFQK